ncbi:MAG TPA: SDR family oxidoreductase [Arenibaculum sp.]|nr:SDR family oxidoreductase [Arenibaculum sp.]
MHEAKMAARVVVVTGAGRGIGFAIAEHLLAEGRAVVLAESDEPAGRAAQARLAAHGYPDGRCRFIQTDVADEGSVAAMAHAASDAFGRVDGLVNNAGIMVRRPVTDLGFDEWRRVLDVNLSGAFLCAKHLVAALRRTEGAIVNIASTRATMSEPDTEAYAASKGGLVALTHALAISLGPEIRVNCVSPGWIETDPDAHLRTADHAQHPAGRVGRPEDVAGLVGWLLSPAADFATGAEFRLDGGMTRKMIYVG